MDAKICDFSMLVTAIAALTNLYLQIRKTRNDERRLYACAELRNLFYRVPFFNSSKFVDRCRANRMPIMTERVIVRPEEPYFDNMFELGSLEPDLAHPESRPYVLMAAVLGWILTGTGVVPDPTTFANDTELWLNHSSPVPGPG